MPEDETTFFEGTVQKRIASKGSKSEHAAFYLMTKGKQYLLRRRGENPFQHFSFNAFEGKTVRCKGTIEDYVLFVDEIKAT
jgi:hypothetical protein